MVVLQKQLLAYNPSLAVIHHLIRGPHHAATSIDLQVAALRSRDHFALCAVVVPAENQIRSSGAAFLTGLPPVSDWNSGLGL